jgi:hypothetical protein
MPNNATKNEKKRKM